MPGRIDIDTLKRMVSDDEIETVIAAFPDMYGRLVGKRFAARYFVEDVIDPNRKVILLLRELTSAAFPTGNLDIAEDGTLRKREPR